MFITKASGGRAKFDQRKVYNTCRRAGADKELADHIVQQVRKNLYNGIPTREILKLTLKLLKKDNPAAATRYSLKKAMLQLGPMGFVFERFMVRFLKSYNYSAWLPEIIRGGCVDHEIDIIAEPLSMPESLGWIYARPVKSDEVGISPRAKLFNRARQKNLYPVKSREAGKPQKTALFNRVYMIECKYHNEAGIRCGLKNTLCVWARFLDLKQGRRQGHGKKFDYPWLMSNTKFSNAAIEYAECKQIRLLGWRYPKKAGLEYLIEKEKVYPITVLRGLDRFSRDRLFSKNIILCQDLVSINKSTIMKKTGIKDKKLTGLINEARLII